MGQKKQQERIEYFCRAVERSSGRVDWVADLGAAGHGWGAFFNAIICGDVAFIEEELDEDETLANRKERMLGLSALHVAVIGNSAAMVRLLIDFGGNVNAKDKRGNTPCDLARLCGARAILLILQQAGGAFSVAPETTGKKEASEKQESVPVQVETKFGGVFGVVKKGDLELLGDLLDDDEDMIDRRSPLRWTPLHVAAWFDRAEVVRLLLEFGASKNARTKDGFTPKKLAELNKARHAFAILSGADSLEKKISEGRLKCHRGETNIYESRLQEYAFAQHGNDTDGLFGVESDSVEFKASGVISAENSKVIAFLEEKGKKLTDSERKSVECLKKLNPISQAWILAKSIAGMANNEGGKIFVGVSDKGKITGLENDFLALNLENFDWVECWDKYSLGLRERIEHMFKTPAVAGVLFQLSPKKVGRKTYFEILIRKSNVPIFICKKPETRYWKKTSKEDEFKEFYLRLGGATKRQTYKDAEEYIKTRFQ